MDRLEQALVRDRLSALGLRRSGPCAAAADQRRAAADALSRQRQGGVRARMSKHVVAPLRDFPPGSRKLVTIDGRPIAIFNINGELFALLNRCPHQGGSLIDGRLIGLVESPEPGDYRYSRQG